MQERYKYLDTYIDDQRSDGQYSFTADDLRKRFDLTDEALKKSLQRLKRKKKVAMVRKGFYVIVPPEYRVKGIIPTSFYVNNMMKFLNRDYYVGLLNAAALHGAAHQQPQNYSIITQGTPLRKIQTDLVNIHFFTKKSWGQNEIEKKKVNTGFINVSSPELTALDLINYHDTVGGFDRIATVLEELSEKILAEKMIESAKHYEKVVVIQRLGYLLDHILEKEELSNRLYYYLNTLEFYPCLLSPQKTKPDRMATGNRWKIVPNIEIETDI
ncbi:MAG: type IV toxin-antitoxin system AbiEi family antitoxin [Bacteroidales bacterium]|nr:type IV toxin-antitoxin system AbiEi family antitoxin [Bacteroidales bacterium]